jgi:glycine C-acetyltransferase/8-amino-7-oxononanoate synthase
VNVEAALEELRRAGLYRRLRTVEETSDGRAVIGGREVLVLCSNDYLGLAHHPEVREAAAEAAQRWGAGAGSSRLVSGNLELHVEAERALAEFKGTEACVLFGSGYLANIGVIAALAGPDDVILSDALNHASLIDGCRLARAKTVVYSHNDLDSLEQGLRAAGRRALIVTDAVFSMDGDVAPLDEIVALARQYEARVLVDEAHATGVIGPGGRGLVAALGLEHDVDVTLGTLSKALGSYGAFACCGQTTAQLLVNRARSLIFSTGLPPASVAAGLASLRLLRERPAMVDRLQDNARAMRRYLAERSVTGTTPLNGRAPERALAVEPQGREVALGPDASGVPIIPLIVGDPGEAVRRSEEALAGGVFVQAIRPPTVPQGTSRLRLTVSATHQEADLRRAADVLAATANAVADR